MKKYIDIDEFLELEEAKLEAQLEALEEIDRIMQNIPGFDNYTERSDSFGRI